jgi:hypothetical protein
MGSGALEMELQMASMEMGERVLCMDIIALIHIALLFHFSFFILHSSFIPIFAPLLKSE